MKVTTKMSDELFEGFDESGSTRYPFLSDGEYDLKVVSVAGGKGHTSGLPFFKVNVTVDSSSGPEALKPGSIATIRIEQSANVKLKKMYLRDIRSVMAAMLGVAEESVTRKELDDVLSQEQPAKGTKFRARRAFYETSEGGVSKWTKYVSETSPFPPAANPPPATEAPRATKRK